MRETQKKATMIKCLIEGLKDRLIRNFQFQKGPKSSSITTGYSSVVHCRVTLSLNNLVCFSGVHLHRTCTTAIPAVQTHGRTVRIFVWLFFFFLFSADIWSDHSFQTDPDLPPGWKKINDVAGIYYWHIPTGTTQWQRPVSIPTDLQGSRKGSLGSITPSPTPETEVTYCVFLWATYCKENWNNFLNLQV